MIPLEIQMFFFIFKQVKLIFYKHRKFIGKYHKWQQDILIPPFIHFILFFGNRNLTHFLGSANFFPANYALVNF